MIQEGDLKLKITDRGNFSWSEALYCPRWLVHTIPTQAQYENIIELAQKLEAIRIILSGRPMTVTSWLRPKVYNKLIGGAKYSMHLQGLACDFHVEGIVQDRARQIIKPHLRSLGLRMEDKPNSNWVHVDLKEVPEGGRRFFIP